ncbi:VWA domain-containing protein [Segetibacter sp. 3557_3]|uniref:Ig-like domain-containing protein n=1 Tax=Segetibacter sp. 3557_3 TaxID=2547429 RepID=UPI001058F18A|nr:Ig-like domain-containing protein [Segetibacter sp. 3557_3]TDH27267.1 VWA domain-containing protein [Segetibacter sp. 3557_3]
MSAKKWICQTDRSHIYNEATDDYFCPQCPANGDIGILILESVSPSHVSLTSPVNGQRFNEGSTITIVVDATVANGSISRVEIYDRDKKIDEATTPPYTFNYQNVSQGGHSLTARVWDSRGASVISDAVNVSVVKVPGEEVGLSVILMDASSSMTDPAFEGSPLTRVRLVATSAAHGIFDLQRMQNNPNAYVAAFKFDDRVELMFMESVAHLINRFDKDVNKFSNYIYDELYKMQQGTDINQALMHAHTFVSKFLSHELSDFPVNKYKIMMQRILKYASADSVSIANIRVLIYTDGMQYDAIGSKVLRSNPFVQYPIEGLNHDIVIGAFFGKENDEGCKELKSLLSRCPIHDEVQFFLFDDPGKISSLKYLFRMASGASGFCPKCLEKELNR